MSMKMDPGVKCTSSASHENHVDAPLSFSSESEILSSRFEPQNGQSNMFADTRGFLVKYFLQSPTQCHKTFSIYRFVTYAPYINLIFLEVI